MKQKRSLSIRAKLTAFFLLAFALPVFGMLLIISVKVESSLKAVARPRVHSALHAIRSEFQVKMKSTRERVRGISISRTLIEDVALYDSRPSDLIRETAAIRTASGLDVLKIVGPDGAVLADGADPAAFGVSDSRDPNVLAAMSGEERVSLRRERLHKGEYLCMNVYRPVRFMGRVIGVLVGGYSIDEEYVRNLHNLSSSVVVITQRYTPIISSAGGSLDDIPVKESFMKELLRSSDRTRSVTWHGQPHLFGGVPLTDGRGGRVLGFVLLGLPQQQEAQILKRTQIDIVYMAVVGFLIALVLGALISLNITRPIGRLVRSARLIGRGHLLEAVTDVRTSDELGLLAGTFNRMIGELREYHERLALTERVAAWREIAQHIAHEIKNPLSPIQLSIENLRRFHASDRAQFDAVFPECSETILEEVDKLRRLANEFSEFARLPKPVFETLDISEIVDNIIVLHARSAPGVSVRVERDEGVSLTVRGDRDQLNRVFTNLIKNAIEAMPGGGELHILERRVYDEVFVVVEDSGVGISRDDLSKIFTPYYTSKPGGSGLGLSIVQRILKDHGASIDVYSDKEAGTKFIIAFRAASPSADPDRSAST